MSSLSSLPVEVVQVILSQLPLPELVLTKSLVCRQWRDIIQAETFLPHRKSYYQYKLGRNITRDRLDKLIKNQVEVIVDLQGLTITQQIHQTGVSSSTAMLERCLPWLLTLFSSPDMMKSLHLTKDMFINLTMHHSYSMCKAILEDRYPHLTSCPMSPLILILCTARNMADCSKALKLLVHNTSPQTEVYLLELFYLISTYMLVFERLYKLPPRPQYLLHHALSLHHNTWLHDPTDLFTPQTVSGHHSTVTLTAEQRKIVHMDLRSMLGKQDTIRIMAYAGTGKTTTLVEMCRRNPAIRFLLVVFNKSVSLHSQRVFPPKVTVKAANALSYKFITETAGYDRFQHYSLKYTDLINMNYIPERKGVFKGFSMYHRAAMIMETLTMFYNSEERDVGMEHTPDQWVTKNKKEAEHLDFTQKKFLMEDAAKVWEIIHKKKNFRVKFDHASSMKEFQLSMPDLQQWAGPHDVLLLDEAQDMNPCMLAVCLKQKCPKIVVGDQHQQIYSFRGAVNALDLVLKSKLTTVLATHFLTQSFRFGPEIAFLANTCLTGLMRSGGPDLVGSNRLDTVTGCIPKGEGRGKMVVLGRTNLRLFTEMVKLVCEPEPHVRPKIAFPTDPSGFGTDPMGWEMLLNLAHFKAGNLHLIPADKRKNRIYSKPWDEYVGQVDAGNDLEMMSKINIVEKFGNNLPGYVEILQYQSQYGMDDSRVEMVFSTVHKFKGLEMDTVRLLDDFQFIGLPYSKPVLERIQVDELNLLYVALTRAKRCLVINDALFFLLSSSFINYSFECLQPVQVAPDPCVKCRGEVEISGAVGMRQEEVRVGDMVRCGGWLCALCASSGVRVVNHTLGGWDKTDGWKVDPGFVVDHNHSWLKCILGPTRGQNVDNVTVQNHETILLNMDPRKEVEEWVEEEEDIFPDDDDAEFLAIVEDFETGFDDDDDLLLAV